MPVDINLGDADAWDDSALVHSWNEALQEYKKYHTIHVKGQKLSDVLTKEELQILAKNGLDIKKISAEDDGAGAKVSDEHMPMIESEDDIAEKIADLQHGEDHQTAFSKAVTTGDHVPVALPQVLINSVKDENVRNLMMSWYWAGYYTGFHEGQQSAGSK